MKAAWALVFVLISFACTAALWLVDFDVRDPVQIRSIHFTETLAYLALFLTSASIVVAASVDAAGRIAGPRSLAMLIAWAMMVIEGAFAAGALIHYDSLLQMRIAAGLAAGSEVHYLGDRFAVLEGEIGYSTFGSLESLSGKQEITYLELNSPGGDIEVAREISAHLRDRGIQTVVRGHCESACVLVALSGSSLSASPNAQFGFHRGSAAASNDSEYGLFIGKLATDELLAELVKLGVPGDILEILEQTPPEEMYYLSGSEMHSIGLVDRLLD